MEELDLLDPAQPEARLESAIARAEFAQRSRNMADAELLLGIDEVLREARDHPELYVDVRQTDAGGVSSSEFAERGAVLDLAVRLGVSESTVRNRAHQAAVLRTRAPRIWDEFRHGAIPQANAGIVVDQLMSLPEVDSEVDARFEDELLDFARRLSPARFRERARVLRERLHPEPLGERHARASSRRGVWVEPDRDGMGWLSMYGDAADLQLVRARLDHAARALADRPDETRTLDQLRADIAADVLTGRDVPDTGRPRATVAVTVPVMTLLGHADEPGTLDGYGPIDPDTARRLAAHAPSFIRLLTHPVSSAVLDVDRTSYRVPADLRKWLGIRDGGCIGPGCGRLASNCDIDHEVDWAKGGRTAAHNLNTVCEPHHRVKHGTRWTVTRQSTGRVRWTSPTGAVAYSDPPPF